MLCFYSQGATSKASTRVQRAVSYLSSHLNEKIKLEQLAERATCRRARLAALFRQQVGESPMQFLEMCRLLHQPRNYCG